VFDIGFLELFTVFVIGLLVIGPERLPQTIKTGAIWFSRLKRSISEARSEFEQQIGADEIRREIHNEQIMDSMKAIEDARHSVQQKIADVNKSLNEAAKGDESNKPSPDNKVNENNTADNNISEQNDIATKPADEPHDPMISDDLDQGDSPDTLPGRRDNEVPEAQSSGPNHLEKQ